MIAQNAVSDIAEVGNLGLVHDDTVLDFAASTDFCSFSKRGSRSEVGIRAHYCTLADINGTLDVGARLHMRFSRQANAALQIHAWFRLSVANLFVRIQR